MFRGRFEHSIDSKGRLSVSAAFRDVLAGKGDNRIMITNFLHAESPCLDVYPFDEWLRLEEQIKAKPRFESRMFLFQNYYVGSATECGIDDHGRILVPPPLRRYANLRKDVILVGALEKFRIWDKEAYNKIFVEAEGKLMQDPNFLNDLGI
jgi:MraZ protein